MSDGVTIESESQESLFNSTSSIDDDSYNGISQNKINRLISKFQQQNVLPPLNDRETVSSYIQHKNIECVVQGNYLEAAKYEELSKRFAFECQKEDQKMSIEEEDNNIKQEITQIKLQLDSLKTSYQNKIEREKTRDMHVIQSLMNEHDQEMQEFEKYWSDPENLRSFCKGSSLLISLRTKQKSLLLAKMFDEAEQIRKEADEVERKETQEAQENIRISVSRKRAALEKKQLDELKRARQYSVKIVDDLRTQMNKDEDQLNARLNKLQQDKKIIERKDFVRENQYSRQRSESVPNGTRHPILSSNHPQSSLSPRSKVIIDNFKRTSKPRRLILKPLAPANVRPSRIVRHTFSK